MLPQTENELLQRSHAIYGWSLGRLARELNLTVPNHSLQRKGWTGNALELILGANAASKALPDFINLGVELKTLPIGVNGKPIESTFVTSVALLNTHLETWASSACYAKLRRVLWFPVEGATTIPFAQRRLGRAWIWSPTVEQAAILEQDWTAIMTLISIGKLHTISASMGTYLQLRPKGANARSLCHYFDEEGYKSQTLPRGFYLRTLFTAQLICT